MPARIGRIKIPDSIRLRVERLINDDLGHHDVGFLRVVSKNGKDEQKVDYVFGFFADSFMDAGTGAAKELMSRLVPWETGWDNAGWVPGTIKESNRPGPCSPNRKVTKKEYERRMDEAKSMEGGYRAYHLFKSNCQHFASEFIK